MSTIRPSARQVAPTLTLLVLSPVIVELLFGSTHLTIISALIPEIGFYGGAALIIRYLVRRQHRGWVSILLLGMAFAIFEEFLIVQTSVSPALFVGSTFPYIYGRLFGVNWVYLLWAVGYESVWGIVLPIYLTELIFPNRRNDPWLGKRGLSTIVAVFVLASAISWYIWTQVVAPAAIGSIYSPPLYLIIFASAMIVVLGISALGPRPTLHPAQRTARMAPQPWLVGSLILVVSLIWFVLVAFAFDTIPAIPAPISIIVGLIVAGTVLFLIKSLSASINWRDTHQLAIIIGGLETSMLAGFWASGIVLAIDFIGKIIFNSIAVILLFYLASRLHNRSRREMPASLAPRDSPDGTVGLLAVDGILLRRLKPRNVEEARPM
jgi:hypothetical protein